MGGCNEIIFTAHILAAAAGGLFAAGLAEDAAGTAAAGGGAAMEHLYGRDGIAYEDYEYQLPKKKLKKETLIKYYDLIRPTRCVIEESQRYLRLNMRTRKAMCPILPSM